MSGLKQLAVIERTFDRFASQVPVFDGPSCAKQPSADGEKLRLDHFRAAADGLWPGLSGQCASASRFVKCDAERALLRWRCLRAYRGTLPQPL